MPRKKEEAVRDSPFQGFASPNYTIVPDELFDQLMPTLSGAELKILLYIIRRTFGFKREGYDLSMRAGSPMLTELSRPAYLFGSTECSACRLQMEDGTGKRTLHPAQYLALAYGLLPAVERRLQEPIGKWVLQ